MCDEVRLSKFINENKEDKMVPTFNFEPYKIKKGIDEANMFAPIYYFKISEELKDFILKQNNLLFSINIDEDYCLENLTLLKNNKVIYACCSHEGIEYYDDKPKEELNDYHISLDKDAYIDVNNKNYNELQKVIIFILNKCDEVRFSENTRDLYPEEDQRICDQIFNTKGRVNLSKINYDFWDSIKENKTELSFKPYKVNMNIDATNMYAPIYYFKLDKEVKEFIIEQGNLIFRLRTECKCALENLTLLRNNKVLYTNSTYKGIEYFDDELINELMDYYYTASKSNSLMCQIKGKYDNLISNKTFDTKELSILHQLYSHVYLRNNNSNYPIYECNEKEYIKLINKYMPQNVQHYFKNLIKFEDFNSNFKDIPFEFYLYLFYLSVFSFSNMQKIESLEVSTKRNFISKIY